jgi:ribosomal protein S4E
MRLSRRNPDAAHAKRLADPELWKVSRRVATVGLHPEEHRHGFIDG